MNIGKIKCPSPKKRLKFSKKVVFSYSGELLSGTIPDGVDRDVLWLITYQHILTPPNYWSKLEAVWPPDVSRNPANGILRFKVPCMSLDFEGWYVIPYYSNYLINENLDVINRVNGEFVKPSKTPNGYYTLRLRDDSGHVSNELRHRIVAISFLKYDYDINDLDINHIDGIPGNDFISNLEIVSRTDNMTHAYMLGLRSDNIPVQIRDVSGNVLTFYSYSSAGRHLGLTETTVSNRVKKGASIIQGGYQFRHMSNDPWPEPVYVKGKYRFHKKDGTYTDCDALTAAILSGLTRTSFLRAVRNGRNVFGNYTLEILSPTGE